MTLFYVRNKLKKNGNCCIIISSKFYGSDGIMKFLTITQGCKVNHFDSDVISQCMISNGYEAAVAGDVPDIIIVNSCTVTENSDKKGFRILSKLRRDYPEAVVVLTGCYPQAFPDEADKNGNADIIVGNAAKEDIPKLVEEFLRSGKAECVCRNHGKVFDEPEEFSHSRNTRAYIKIEDGCDRFCSYCIIPKARGRVRSKGLERIAAEAKFHAEDGHREIVLTGINLSCYGTDIGLSLYDAVKAAADQPLIERVRLSSLEPELLTDELIGKLAEVDKLCPHFHLSLQSGCSSTLKRMNRHYSAEEYREIAERLRMAFPCCGITTDVMVGFAGETEEEFEQSVQFVKSIGFARVHVFTYSVRPGTRAAEMENQVSAEIKEHRYKVMSEIGESARGEFWRRNMGTVHKVLIERQTNPDFINGYTENYIPVRIYGGKAKRHDIIAVEITGVEKEFCVGRETT